MKYVAKIPEENSNITKGSPLATLLRLLLIIGGFSLAGYFVLGLFVDIVARNASDDLEIALGKAFRSYVEARSYDDPATTRYLQTLLDRLAENLPKRKFEYRIVVIEDDTVNVVAMPGGYVGVFRGFLEQAESENEIVMVLGHELGHFKNRDHLRGLGRALVTASLSHFLFGDETGVSSLVNSSVYVAQMQYSKAQELAADETGLELLQKIYGHVGGATDFFSRFEDTKIDSRWLSFLSTHPAPSSRVEQLQRLISKRGYPSNPVQPIHID